jgi:hypothetical protein
MEFHTCLPHRAHVLRDNGTRLEACSRTARSSTPKYTTGPSGVSTTHGTFSWRKRFCRRMQHGVTEPLNCSEKARHASRQFDSLPFHGYIAHNGGAIESGGCGATLRWRFTSREISPANCALDPGGPRIAVSCFVHLLYCHFQESLYANIRVSLR